MQPLLREEVALEQVKKSSGLHCLFVVKSLTQTRRAREENDAHSIGSGGVPRVFPPAIYAQTHTLVATETPDQDVFARQYGAIPSIGSASRIRIPATINVLGAATVTKVEREASDHSGVMDGGRYIPSTAFI